MERDRKGGYRHPPPGPGGKSFMAVLRARSTVLVSGDSSCFHLDYSHFFKFQKQQKERESVSPSHLPAFTLSVFEPADQSCLHWEQEQTSVVGCIS